MMGSYVVEFKIPSTQLQGKPLAPSFRPSTDADAQAIINALPKPDASGNLTQVSYQRVYQALLK